MLIRRYSFREKRAANDGTGRFCVLSFVARGEVVHILFPEGKCVTDFENVSRTFVCRPIARQNNIIFSSGKTPALWKYAFAVPRPPCVGGTAHRIPLHRFPVARFATYRV